MSSLRFSQLPPGNSIEPGAIRTSISLSEAQSRGDREELVSRISRRARASLDPNEVYEFNIEIRPFGILLKPGERIGIKIKSADNDPAKNYLDLVGIGHVSSGSASQVTVHHNSDYPSHLVLPITKGNRIGTFISGGKLPPVKRP